MSQLYPKGAQHILNGDIDFATDTIKTLWYGGAFNAAHEFVSDLTGGSIVLRTGALAGKTITLGVFDANDISGITDTAGSAVPRVILYKDTGADATSILIASFDISPTFTTTGSDNEIFNAAGLFSIA